MPTNDAGNPAERLDALWDHLNGAASHYPHPHESDDAAFIASLQNSVPHLSESARERIRHRVFEPTEGATTIMLSTAAAHDRGDLIAPLPPDYRLRNRLHLDHPWIRAAAVLLLALSFIGGWAALQNNDETPGGGTLYPAVNGSTPNQQAIVPATPGAENNAPLDGTEFAASMPIDIDLPNEEIEVRIVLNEVTIEPGASWSVPFDLANQFRGRSGEITITAGNTGPSTSIGAGEFASYGSGNLLVLTNNGSEPAELMHGIILIADPNGPEVIPPDGVTIEIFGAGSFFASGPVTAMMTVERVSGTGSSTMVHGELLDVRLYTVLDGAMELTRLAGQIEVQKIGEAPMAPRTLEAIGDRIDLTAGESFFAHSGASYRFESAESGQLATLVVHTRAPQVATSASPVASPNASPAAESDGTSHRSEGNLLPVRAEYCTVEARPLDEFAAILADPYVSGTPVANFRSDSATGVPADDETIAGVTDTILQIVACNSPASIEMYSLYSQNALRFQAMHGMTIEEIESLEPFAPDTDYPGHVLGHVAVENVTLLPDGRATAMVSANGEIAFVTFIYEDGRWLIDFWDDSLED